MPKIEDPTKRVHEVTILHKDKTKTQFFGVIVALEFDRDRIVLLKWQNVDYTNTANQPAGYLQSKRLRFVDITSIRAISERCIDASGEYKFDKQVYCLANTGK